MKRIYNGFTFWDVLWFMQMDGFVLVALNVGRRSFFWRSCRWWDVEALWH